MAIVIKMPKQGQSVERCILTQWYKDTGDRVQTGDLLFSYETDKAAFDQESTAEGILLTRFFKAGDEVPVMESIAVIGSKGESIEEYRPGKNIGELPETNGKKAGGIPVTENQVPAQGMPPANISSGRTMASPRARRLATEKRVLIKGIRGSGPNGRIIAKDILGEIEKGKRLTPLAMKKVEAGGLAVPPEGKSAFGRIHSHDLIDASTNRNNTTEGEYSDRPLSNMRKIIGSAMLRSLQHSPQVTHHLSADASGLLRLRKEVKNRMETGYQYNITLNDMLCFTVIHSLKNFPALNAQFLEDRIRMFKGVHLGIAVDTERGLMVPVLRNGDELSLTGLSSRLKYLIDSSKNGNLSPDLIRPEAASFTISNLGMYGIEMFTPVLNLPQVAILGVNTILQRPVHTEDGILGFRPFIGLSLTYDHRAVDGGPASRFLEYVKTRIEAISPVLLS
jgi:pyruvate dehydrogenase E2 component (dihydrolipoamide acetyltransferase)